MKKSKFLKSSKDMLSRSFDPAKCKTSLRLAGSRLKLSRNKKEVQVKQMKREIAQLLESGQDQTARIRVEHVIREEKMMAAYDLMEIYCELIVARLPIIESQKICPIDLKEAIASVVFASPRCGDIPELADVRKHFTHKYGKDFTTAAIELRPDCGASRMLVEKLSAAAPDGQTKIKILSAIAEEHNVKWDPKSFEENSVPASDLLTGPSTFGKESKLHVEPSHFEGSNVQGLQSNNQVHGSPLNFTQVDNRTSLGKERLASPRISGINTASQHEARPPGDERAQLFQGDSNTIPLDRQRWNMEFRDATSAAQAAAESAELASMAARAAAELSNRDRIMRQYSTESRNSDANVLKDGRPEAYGNSKLVRGQSSEESMNRSFSGHTRSQNEQIDSVKPNNLQTDGRFNEAGRDGRKEYTQSASLKSKASIDNDSLDHGVPAIDGYSRNNSLKEVSRGEMGMQRESFLYKAESADGWLGNSEDVREERFRKQLSDKSSHSHSHYSISNDVNIFSNPEDQKFEYDAGEDYFLGFGKKSIYEEASQTGSHESATVVFDKSDSESENHGFDFRPTYDEPEQGFQLPLSGQKSHERRLTNTDSWSPRSSTNKTLKPSSSVFLARKSSSPDFSERSMNASRLDDSLPATFDESDGSASESDEDMNISRHTRNPRDFLSRQNQSVGLEFKDKSSPSVGSPLKQKGSPGFDRKQWSLSSDYGLKSEETARERDQGKTLDADPSAKFSLRKPSADQPASLSSPESEERLNFGKLTGGFRHKGYNRPPYLTNQVDVSSSLNKENEETTATIPKFTAPPAVESSRIRTMFEHKKSRTPYLQSESDSESSEEEESLQKSSDHTQEIHTPTIGKDVKTKPRLAASNSIFGSDNSDSDEDLPKESLSRTSHLHTGISRRTRAFPSGSGEKNYSKIQLRSDTTESQRNSSKLGTYEQPTSTKVASKPGKSKFWGAPEYSNSGEKTSVILQESRPDAHDYHTSMERKPTKSYSSESRQQFQSSKGNSSHLGNLEPPSSTKVASLPTNSRGTQDRYNSGKTNSPMIQASKVNHKSSAIEESSVPPRTTEASNSRENQKAATLNKTSSNKDSSNQKASHVHPKLPDYDNLVQFFQKNRS